MKSLKDILQKSKTKRLLLIFAVLIVLFFGLNDLLMPWYVKRAEVQVPSVVGKPVEQAKQILAAAGLDPREGEVLSEPNYPVGTVISQNPPETKMVKQGRRVYLTLSGGERHVLVPDVYGHTLRDAKFQIEQAGLQIGHLEYQGSDSLPQNTIISQSIRPKVSVKHGAYVGLIVSQGRLSEKQPAPELVNKTVKEAAQILTNLGLKVGKITYQFVPDVLPNTIVDQFPRVGEMVQSGGTVDLFVAQQGELQNNLEEN